MNKGKLLALKETTTEYLPEPVQGGLKKGKGFLKEFREFAIKGNAMDLAVGVVIGAAFTGIVNSIVKDLITPLISVLTGSIDFSNRFLTLKGRSFETLAEAEKNGSIVFKYGTFLNAVINFVIVAFVIFLVIKQINRFKTKEEKKITKKECPFCFEKINKKATVCPNCTSKLK